MVIGSVHIPAPIALPELEGSVRQNCEYLQLSVPVVHKKSSPSTGWRVVRIAKEGDLDILQRCAALRIRSQCIQERDKDKSNECSCLRFEETESKDQC